MRKNRRNVLLYRLCLPLRAIVVHFRTTRVFITTLLFVLSPAGGVYADFSGVSRRIFSEISKFCCMLHTTFIYYGERHVVVNSNRNI